MGCESFSILFERLVPDPFRTENGFTDDVAEANGKLFAAEDDSLAEQVLGDWLGTRQPCLFGRMAARSGLISYCILREADLFGDPAALQKKIQKARRRWTRKGFTGQKSAFVILAISKDLSDATPDATVMEIATK